MLRFLFLFLLGAFPFSFYCPCADRPPMPRPSLYAQAGKLSHEERGNLIVRVNISCFAPSFAFSWAPFNVIVLIELCAPDPRRDACNYSYSHTTLTSNLAPPS